MDLTGMKSLPPTIEWATKTFMAHLLRSMAEGSSNYDLWNSFVDMVNAVASLPDANTARDEFCEAIKPTWMDYPLKGDSLDYNIDRIAFYSLRSIANQYSDSPVQRHRSKDEIFHHIGEIEKIRNGNRQRARSGY